MDMAAVRDFMVIVLGATSIITMGTILWIGVLASVAILNGIRHLNKL